MNTVEEIIEGYTDAYRNHPLTDLYREQDRIMMVIHRLNVMRPVPLKMVDMLERKLQALEFLIEAKYRNPDFTFDRTGTDA